MDTQHLLVQAGLRATAARRRVLDAIAGTGHVTALDLRARLPDLSVQGLYNVLADLEQVQLVRRIEPAGSAARYETRVGDNHHHIVCRSCGTISDVDCVTGRAPCLAPSSTPGFSRIDEAEVTWWGLCDGCATA